MTASSAPNATSQTSSEGGRRRFGREMTSRRTPPTPRRRQAVAGTPTRLKRPVATAAPSWNESIAATMRSGAGTLPPIRATRAVADSAGGPEGSGWAVARAGAGGGPPGCAIDIRAGRQLGRARRRPPGTPIGIRRDCQLRGVSADAMRRIMPPRPGRGRRLRPGPGTGLAVDRVLHLAGGLAQVALGLLATALVLEALVVAVLAGGLLGLARGLVDLAAQLVTHLCTAFGSGCREPRRIPRPVAAETGAQPRARPGVAGRARVSAIAEPPAPRSPGG